MAMHRTIAAAAIAFAIAAFALRSAVIGPLEEPLLLLLMGTLFLLAGKLLRPHRVAKSGPQAEPQLAREREARS
jgi:hypothetical protein